MEALFLILICAAIILAIGYERPPEGGFRHGRQAYYRFIDANGRVYYINSSGKKVFCNSDGTNRG